jgi:class 3 adenylate cyclase/tetratricopeptide (TPR) repeat protein
MQQIADWLKKLGMSEYAKCFAENRIDFSVLPDLTDHDLEKLGVVLGDRRKMLRAIANLEAHKITVAAAAPAGPPRDTAERRQVTVMFSDLVGSTALSARMDPEDLREIISAYQKCVAETVRRFDGFVAKYLGDGVLVYFGYPRAHEDDAERAVRAGLELVQAVGGLQSGVSLQTRVGIATGLVVVGDLIGSGAAQEQAVVGETPNVAARLQSTAEANTVVIAESTRKLLGNLFDVEDLGAQDLKGVGSPVRVWAVLRTASVESRFEALHASGLTELVGREEELELLLRRWSKAKSSEGQVVLLSGEAGIGKSRLTAAMLERLANEPHTRLRYFCSPQHTDSALYPVTAQIAKILESQFAEFAENHSELLARHWTEAAQIEKAALLWGKAGQRSLARSALVEAVEQLTRALAQIATLPTKRELRREEIKLQVALITPLIHVKGYAAPETKAAAERARLLIDQSEALGEPPEDPLLLFSPLYGLCIANYVAFNGDVIRELAAQFLAVAKKQSTTGPLMIGHRLMAMSLASTGDLVEGMAHYNQALALYDPAEHRSLATRFGQDVRIAILSYRSLALWVLGHPEAALADAENAVKDAREIGQAASLMYALSHVSRTYLLVGDYARARTTLNELSALADENGAAHWRTNEILVRGSLLALNGESTDAIHMLPLGIAAWRSAGATVSVPWYLSHLAGAHADLGKIDDASRCIRDALAMIDETKENLWEAEANRMVGEIALKAPQREETKAQAYFERALEVARAQQAKSWELRAAVSMARLWRDQGKRDEARDLLAPVYGWFTEGFDTLDLKEAKALLDELAS